MSPLLDDFGEPIPCSGCMQRPVRMATHYSPDSLEACCDGCQAQIDAWVAGNDAERPALPSCELCLDGAIIAEVDGRFVCERCFSALHEETPTTGARRVVREDVPREVRP